MDVAEPPSPSSVTASDSVVRIHHIAYSLLAIADLCLTMSAYMGQPHSISSGVSSSIHTEMVGVALHVLFKLF